MKGLIQRPAQQHLRMAFIGAMGVDFDKDPVRLARNMDPLFQPQIRACGSWRIIGRKLSILETKSLLGWGIPRFA